MARKPRIHFPDALYHVMLQGNGGGNVFVDDRVRHGFQGSIAERSGRVRYRTHACCWCGTPFIWPSARRYSLTPDHSIACHHYVCAVNLRAGQRKYVHNFGYAFQQGEWRPRGEAVCSHGNERSFYWLEAVTT